MLLISSIVQCFHFCWGHYEFVMHKCSTIYFPSDYVGSRNRIVQGNCSAPHNLITKINKFCPPLTAFHKSTWWWCHKSWFQIILSLNVETMGSPYKRLTKILKHLDVISLLMQVSTSRLMCTLVMWCAFGLWYITLYKKIVNCDRRKMAQLGQHAEMSVCCLLAYEQMMECKASRISLLSAEDRH